MKPRPEEFDSGWKALTLDVRAVIVRVIFLLSLYVLRAVIGRLLLDGNVWFLGTYVPYMEKKN